MKKIIQNYYDVFISQKNKHVLYSLFSFLMAVCMKPTVVVGFMPMACMILLLNATTYNHDKEHNFLESIPNETKDTVISKYIFTILGTIMAWTYAVELQLILILLSNKQELDLRLIISDTRILTVQLLIAAVMLPMYIYYDAVKHKDLVFIIIGTIITIKLSELIPEIISFVNPGIDLPFLFISVIITVLSSLYFTLP